MVRARLLALAVLATLAVAACASASTASWTYAPASPATPAPSASAGASAAASSSAASASAGASAASSAGASASAGASPAASGGGAGTTVEIVAQGIAFTTANVTVLAGQPFTLKFTNNDAGVPHNVHVRDSSGADVAKTDIISGVSDASIQVAALQPGTYPFVCDVHPNMTGTLTVK